MGARAIKVDHRNHFAGAAHRHDEFGLACRIARYMAGERVHIGHELGIAAGCGRTAHARAERYADARRATDKRTKDKFFCLALPGGADPVEARPVEIGQKLPQQRSDIGHVRHAIRLILCQSVRRVDQLAVQFLRIGPGLGLEIEHGVFLKIRSPRHAWQNRARLVLFRARGSLIEPLMGILRKLAIALAVFVVIVGGFLYFISRGDTAGLSVEAVAGTDPTLEEPDPESFPTVNVAKPVGWAKDQTPEAADGLVVNRFAEGLDHPRVLYALPNGDVLVTLTRAPTKEDKGGGGVMDAIEGMVAEYLFKQAGAAGASANEVVLLRDANGDGVAEIKRTILSAEDGLDSPSGLSWGDGKLFVANHNAVIAFDYELGADAVTSEGEKLMDLPPGGGHWMRNMEIHPDGDRLYIAVGSVSNIGEKGMAIEEGRAMIWEYTIESGSYRPFGAGMRNPNGLDFSPWSGELWTTVNERDMLGSDLVPDYLTNVPVGVQYGWPWVYYRDNIDRRVKARMPRFLMEYTRRPVYAMGPHVAALGLVFTREGHRMGEAMASGAFVARHGSWNRKPASGYDVVYVAFDERGMPTGKPVPVLDGFLQADGTTRGRPTWVEWAADGSLLVSDDTAGIIWRALAPEAEPGAGIERIATKKIPPRRELRDPRASFEEDYLREQAGQAVGN